MTSSLNVASVNPDSISITALPAHLKCLLSKLDGSRLTLALRVVDHMRRAKEETLPLAPIEARGWQLPELVTV